MKVGRNQQCPCGSGVKYKYCCIRKELPARILDISNGSDEHGTPQNVDFTLDIMNHASSLGRTLQYFCKDQGLYFFSSTLTVGQVLRFSDELKAGKLTKVSLFEAYVKGTTKQVALGLIDDACANFPCFGPRRQILSDAINAHYQGTYTLSVPVLFAQIEGIMREVGTLEPRESLKPTIKRDWDSRLLFGMTDNAAMFNAFLQNLYEGQRKSGDFNRNPVLHGIDTNYATEENSLFLLLTLLEIRIFLWFERNTKPLF